jgi:hypothetical protein
LLQRAVRQRAEEAVNIPLRVGGIRNNHVASRLFWRCGDHKVLKLPDLPDNQKVVDKAGDDEAKRKQNG